MLSLDVAGGWVVMTGCVQNKDYPFLWSSAN